MDSPPSVYFTRDEIVIHNMPNDIWITIHEVVFDLSNFIKNRSETLNDVRKYLILQTFTNFQDPVFPEPSIAYSICWKRFELGFHQAWESIRTSQSTSRKRSSFSTGSRKGSRWFQLLVVHCWEYHWATNMHWTSYPSYQHFDQENYSHERLRRRFDPENSRKVFEAIQPWFWKLHLAQDKHARQSQWSHFLWKKSYAKRNIVWEERETRSSASTLALLCLK